MGKHSGFWRWFLPVALLYATGFAAAAVWDLAITAGLYRPTSMGAALMEAFGWYPAFLPALLLAILIATERGPSAPGPARRALAGAVTLLGTAAIYYVSYGYLKNRGLLTGPSDPATWIWLLTGVLCTLAVGFFIYRVTGPVREKLAFCALFGSVYMVANQILTYAVKYIWARPRFDDMLATGTLEMFRPWYLPFGPGGSSFPSGHTANAMGIFVLLILCDVFPSWRRNRKLVLVACWGFVGLMAVCRMVIGRHFLSDTLAASGLMALTFYALHHSKFYQKELRRLLESVGNTPAGNH